MAGLLKRPALDRRRRRRCAGSVAVALLIAAGCSGGSAERANSGPDDGKTGYVVLDESIEPLRAAFNAASGGVRAVLLAAPT